ncbi:MAG: hypothetical protein A3H91_05800 [Gammaproteobacteria bacterium RIFCSPLOWO2_02_FULL_61_13]|nr:MAG: hypothetical protein A3H91_05800 [Gammaproteobacteria bacterium RIFCSPLOWO2_02_FULL_61_13]
MTHDAKVFGIGFHKTGTKSLAAALQRLGYRVTGSNAVHDPDIARRALDLACELAEQFDAFQDNPWPLLYREMDARYPGSRFILTTRPTEKWILSVRRYFGGKSTPMREWIYGAGRGCALGNEDVYVERYERHNREVRAYFANRPGDLLELALTEGEGWEKLCPFLGKTIPPVPFPHANKSEDRG